MSYANTPTDELKDDLNHLTATTAEAILEMSKILLELHRRGERHNYMREGSVLRWYREIAEGKLAPIAVLTFGGVGSVIRKLIGMPLDQQEALARGEKIAIADHDAAGKIVSAKRTILQLTTRQLDLAFDNGSIRPFAAQKRALAARTDAHKKDVRRSGVAVAIRADTDTGELVCGQLRFKPYELTTALKQLGFEIKRIARPSASAAMRRTRDQEQAAA